MQKYVWQCVLQSVGKFADHVSSFLMFRVSPFCFFDVFAFLIQFHSSRQACELGFWMLLGTLGTTELLECSDAHGPGFSICVCLGTFLGSLSQSSPRFGTRPQRNEYSVDICVMFVSISFHETRENITMMRPEHCFTFMKSCERCRRFPCLVKEFKALMC